MSYTALSVNFSLRGTGDHYFALETLVRGDDSKAEEQSAEVLIFTGREHTDGVRTLCLLWIETKTGKIQEDHLQMEIVEGANWDWDGYYDKIGEVTDKWLSQQPKGEIQPPNESGSASAGGSDQTGSFPAKPPIVQGRSNRFSGQVL